MVFNPEVGKESYDKASGLKEEYVAKTSLMHKALRKPKFPVRKYNRCPLCGRPRAYYRRFDMCRICFRNLALEGKLPGVIKSSW